MKIEYRKILSGCAFLCARIAEDNMFALKMISLFGSMIFYAPVALLVRTRAGITYSQFFLLQAAVSVGATVFEMPSGVLSDKLGYKKTLIISNFCMLAARILIMFADNFALFAAEALMEGVAAALNSGTVSGYIYSRSKPGMFVKNTALMGNYSNAGFFAATLGFAVLNTMFGMPVLLLSTVSAAFLAALFSLALEKDGKEHKEYKRHTERREHKEHKLSDEQGLTKRNGGITLEIVGENARKESLKHNLFLKEKESQDEVKKTARVCLKIYFCDRYALICGKFSVIDIMITAAQGIVSLGFVLINFFYVSILLELGIHETYMSVIILLYTGVQLFLPYFVRVGRRKGLAFQMQIALWVAATLAFGIAFVKGLYILLPVLLLPAALALFEIYLDNYRNLHIDSMGLQNNRVTILSGYSMLANLIEILFLTASSQISRLGVHHLFFGLGISLALLSAVLCITPRPAEQRRQTI